MILENYHHIQGLIQQYKSDFELPQNHEIRLMVVSKTRTLDEIRVLLKAGHRLFGENRVQEAKEKFSILRQEYPDLELHLIGPLQSNKFKDCLGLFDAIESIDRYKIIDLFANQVANQVANQAQNNLQIPDLYVQINIGQEPQKSGFAPRECQVAIEYMQKHGLKVKGLMCVPPEGVPASPYFALLYQLAKENNIAELSMGMSHDFKDAIALHSNIIRIGSAIFGARV